MWKESYRIGIESIDKQHFGLFKMVENLLKIIENDKEGNQKEKYKKSIDFMKSYVIKHFKDEENYQQSINYNDIENHKKEHENFVNTVLEFEKKLVNTDYDIKIVKKFSGTLVVWLIHHVIETDQKIVSNNVREIDNDMKCYSQYVYETTSQVFKSMFNINLNKIPDLNIIQEGNPGDIFVKINLTGDLEKEVVFGFSKEIALCIIKIMTLVELDNVDEIAYYAMMEIANIIMGNVTTKLSEKNLKCNITSPELTNLQYYSDFVLKDNVHITFETTEIGRLCFAVFNKTIK